MKRVIFIVIAITPFLFGSSALAAPCQQGVLAERLACLSKLVGDLQAQIKTLKQALQKAGPAGTAGVPSENLIRWIRSRKENRIMIETDGDLLQTSARIYVGLLSFA